MFRELWVITKEVAILFLLGTVYHYLKELKTNKRKVIDRPNNILPVGILSKPIYTSKLTFLSHRNNCKAFFSSHHDNARQSISASFVQEREGLFSWADWKLCGSLGSTSKASFLVVLYWTCADCSLFLKVASFGFLMKSLIWTGSLMILLFFLLLKLRTEKPEHLNWRFWFPHQ